jgi:UDP-N-acetylmuramoyl-tripeptide--D-alanyl-D-alanine ligase
MSGGAIERVRTAAYDGYLRASYRRAARHRRGLEHVIFVGVTGSAGKTTTKDLVAAVLASRYRGSKSPGTHNSAHWVSRTVLDVRRGDEFCVQELGASGPGTLDEPIALVRPRVAVITNIGGDHRKAFRTLQATATEKAKVVAAVPAEGLVVLNADDPRVMAMASTCRGRVITYGLTPDAAVHAESVTSSWPDRLSFVAIHGEQRVVVHTRFCGVHWVHACLAAISTGVGLGIPLAEAAGALAAVEPWSARLDPVKAGGVTFMRDECKASLWSIGPSLEFLRDARAPRKVAVIGTISDYGGRASAVYASVARRALDVADEVVFVGPQAHRCGAARAHPKGAALHAFLTAREAHKYLSGTLVAGDLVLLKGSQRADHLLRLVLARKGWIACWRTACRRIKFCDECVLLRVPELPWPGRGGRLAAEPVDA